MKRKKKNMLWSDIMCDEAEPTRVQFENFALAQMASAADKRKGRDGTATANVLDLLSIDEYGEPTFHIVAYRTGKSPKRFWVQYVDVICVGVLHTSFSNDGTSIIAPIAFADSGNEVHATILFDDILSMTVFITIWQLVLAGKPVRDAEVNEMIRNEIERLCGEIERE